MLNTFQLRDTGGKEGNLDTWYDKRLTEGRCLMLQVILRVKLV